MPDQGETFAKLHKIKNLRKATSILMCQAASSGSIGRANTGRRVWDVEGNVDSEYVAVHNRIAKHAALIIEVCCGLGLHYVVEQPASSLLWHFRLGRTRARERGCESAQTMRRAQEMPAQGDACARLGTIVM